MASKEDDYTRYRTTVSGSPPYEITDIIGRPDYKKYTLTTTDLASVSGTSGSILI